MRRLFVIAVLLLATAAAPAAAAQRGTSSEGVRFTLDRRVVTIVFPAALAAGERVEAECGRVGMKGTAVARGRARGRGLRTVRVRLRRGRLERPEWCHYERRSSRGAAQLRPGADAVERVRPGPGVREGFGPGDEDYDAHALLRGSVATVELQRPFTSSRMVDVLCFRGERRIGHRAFAVRAGQRVVTADLEANLATVDFCLVEEDGGSDVGYSVFR